jgi:hypothetical protein
MVPLFYFVSVEVELAQAYSDSSAMADSLAAPHERFIENLAFGAGEKLSFDINYGFINAGTATLEVAQLIEYQDRPCYQIISRAHSNKVFSTFFKVDDRIESIIDARGIYSWRFEKNLREGGYSADRIYSFDQPKGLAYYEGDTIEVPPVVQDALSVLYYIRTQELQVGSSIFLDNFTDGDQFPLEVKVVKRESISVEAGDFDCIVVEPLTQSVGVFKNEGKLTVWLTDDRLKMPVLMKSKVLVGSITAELTDYELGELAPF